MKETRATGFPSALSAWLVRKLSGVHADYLMVGVATLLLIGAFPWFRSADPDLFARVATGELIQQVGTMPVSDQFAFTPIKAVWHDHEWLISVLFYFLASLGGDAALFLLKVGMFALSIFLIIRTQSAVSAEARARGAASADHQRQYTLVAGFVWLLVMLPEILNGFLPNVRCQMATMLGVAFWMFVFARTRSVSATENRRSLLPLLLPLMMIFWVNSHGGFVVGLAQSAIFLMGCLLRRDRLCGVAILSLLGCIAAVLINPWGVSYVQFMIDAALHSRPLITEWGPLPLFSMRWWIGGILGLVFIVGIYRAPRLLRFEDSALLFLALWQSFSNSRLMPIFAIIAAGLALPLVHSALGGVLKAWRVQFVKFRDAASGAFVLLVLVALGSLSVEVATSIRSSTKPFAFDYRSYPAEAVSWLCANRQGGNILVHFNEASYVLWALRGSFKVAIDGRYEEVYPEETFLRSLAAVDTTHPQHLESLEWVSPDYILIRNVTSGSGLADFPDFESIFKTQGWEILQSHRLPSSSAIETKVMAPSIEQDLWSAHCRDIAA